MKQPQIQKNLQRRNLLPFAAIAVVSGTTALLLLSMAGPRIQPPVEASSKQSRAAGSAVFHDKGCEHCHGVNGVGTDRGPDLSSVGKRWKKDHIELQIRNGGGGMPPFGGALQADEVQSLVDYLRAKRQRLKKLPEPVGSKPPSQDDGG